MIAEQRAEKKSPEMSCVFAVAEAEAIAVAGVEAVEYNTPPQTQSRNIGVRASRTNFHFGL